MNKIYALLLATLWLSACNAKNDDYNLVFETKQGNVYYNVEEAQTTQELETGLMNREILAENSGMIFDLSQVQNKVAMWMKDTKISLDMVFVNQDGVVVYIHENAKPMSEELIISPEPAWAVIELNSGDVKKHGISLGDKAKHRFINENVTSTSHDTSKEQNALEPVADQAEKAEVQANVEKKEPHQN